MLLADYRKRLLSGEHRKFSHQRNEVGSLGLGRSTSSRLRQERSSLSPWICPSIPSGRSCCKTGFVVHFRESPSVSNAARVKEICHQPDIAGFWSLESKYNSSLEFLCTCLRVCLSVCFAGHLSGLSVHVSFLLSVIVGLLGTCKCACMCRKQQRAQGMWSDICTYMYIYTCSSSSHCGQM